jgi:class 3 adenylate cyclase/predicted ATPase
MPKSHFLDEYVSGGYLPSANVRPLSLMIRRKRGCVAMFLSDSRSVAYSLDATVADSLLEEFLRAAEALQIPSTEPHLPSAPCEVRNAMRRLGADLYGQLFPGPIRKYLARSPTTYLSLQIQESLLRVPWELAFDGEVFLAEKFLVSRQVLSRRQQPLPHEMRAASGEMRILLIGNSPAAPVSGPYCHSLAQHITNATCGVAPTLAAVQDGRQFILDLIPEHDVVHYIGAVSGAAAPQGDITWWDGTESITVRDLARLRRTPQLIVCEIAPASADREANFSGAHAFAGAACRLQLNVLLGMWPGFPTNDNLEYMRQVYAGLRQGAGLAESVRTPRAVPTRLRHTTSFSGLGAVLYGDPLRTVVTGAAAGLHQVDNRRQITILACDIVRSTELLKSLGDERYSEILSRYHRTVAEIVRSHLGSIEDPHGDGIIAFFGFPAAQEDCSTQAVKAAIAICSAVHNLNIEVRIGISTGPVAVQKGEPVGDVIHFAARLQAEAIPGQILVSEATRDIVSGHVAFEPLQGKHNLKGFGESARLYRVVPERRAPGSRAAENMRHLTPFLGRLGELQTIEREWLCAQSGEVRTVVITGDAGIGKSRLVREFRSGLSTLGHDTYEFRCSPQHASSAFYPLIEFLRGRLGLRNDESVEAQQERVERIVSARAPVQGAATLVADLLGVSRGPQRPASAHALDRQRRLTLDLMVRWLGRESRKSAVCVIVEDIHWIDPSSKDLLGLVCNLSAPVLVLATVRTECAQAPMQWISGPVIELKGLSQVVAREMVQRVSGKSPLGAEVVRLLAQQGDGVPLYIEESTRMAVELSESANRKDVAFLIQSAVPSRIHDLLMARLDRLGDAKQVAQLGGTIGREFPLALLEAVLNVDGVPMRIQDLPSQLDALLESGLVIPVGDPRDRRFAFKHALVRDAAYQSLWERDRKSLHRLIAGVISERFPALVEIQPELLAYHYTQAGLDTQAVTYWERAARLAASRSAYDEAISHLNSALRLIEIQPDTRERRSVELRLLLLLAGRLIATEGYGADRVEEVYTRALELCTQVGDPAALRKARLGMEGYYFMRADFTKAREFAEQVAAMDQPQPFEMRTLQADWAISNILFHQGELESAVTRMDQCLKKYDRAKHHPGAVQDPGVMCLCYSAWALWELGYPDEAMKRANEVIALSHALGHKFSIGQAYGICAGVHFFRGENELALMRAGQAVEICEVHGFSVWLAHAKMLRGRMVAELGRVDDGIEEMLQAYSMWTKTGAVVTRPFYLAMLAEGYALAGRVTNGLAALDNAREIIRTCGERYYEPEIQRLVGELLSTSKSGRSSRPPDEAERWFRSAIEVARERRLRSLELRAATSLARLLGTYGRGCEASPLLAEILNSFTEGLDTFDVRQARRVLGELG